MISVGRVFGEGVIKNRKTKPLRPWRFVWGWQKKISNSYWPPRVLCCFIFCTTLELYGIWTAIGLLPARYGGKGEEHMFDFGNGWDGIR